MLFADGDWRTIWRAEVSAGPTLHISAPTRIATLPEGIIAIDASPDRQRFLAIAPERTGPGAITIVQNWAAALRER